MGSRGASHPTKRRTDPAAEHCDPYELVDRAREGALDESSRRRLSMVLRSQRDAALELAWMELFDTVREPRRTRERLEAERVEHDRTERIVQRIVARAGGTRGTSSSESDDARTRRWVAVDAEGRPVDEDARTRRWPVVSDPTHEGVEPCVPPSSTRSSRPKLATRSPNVLGSGAATDDVDDAAHTRPWSAVPPALSMPPARTGETAPWSAAPWSAAPWSAVRAPRRDETPRGTPLDARGRARSWVALWLTAALSIAAGWLAHGWWDAATSPDAPPVVAGPPTIPPTR
jgi:hypothetical protein